MFRGLHDAICLWYRAHQLAVVRGISSQPNIGSLGQPLRDYEALSSGSSSCGSYTKAIIKDCQGALIYQYQPRALFANDHKTDLTSASSIRMSYSGYYG